MDIRPAELQETTPLPVPIPVLTVALFYEQSIDLLGQFNKVESFSVALEGSVTFWSNFVYSAGSP